jgi:hypothetical protein
VEWGDCRIYRDFAEYNDGVSKSQPFYGFSYLARGCERRQFVIPGGQATAAFLKAVRQGRRLTNNEQKYTISLARGTPGSFSIWLFKTTLGAAVI